MKRIWIDLHSQCTLHWNVWITGIINVHYFFAPNTDSEHLARIVDKREDGRHFNNSIKKPQTWLCITFAVQININQTFYYCAILGLLKVVKTDRSNLISFLYLNNQKSERIWILYNSRQIYKNVTNIFEWEMLKLNPRVIMKRQHV